MPTACHYEQMRNYLTVKGYPLLLLLVKSKGNLISNGLFKEDWSAAFREQQEFGLKARTGWCAGSNGNFPDVIPGVIQVLTCLIDRFHKSKKQAMPL